jgi:hypothetical protein
MAADKPSGQIGTEQTGLGRFSKLYAFTTENFSGYYPFLPLLGSKVLTVTCSGDQMINSYLFGADSVTGFDINPAASYFAELKLAALRDLSFEDFKQFFMLHGKAGKKNSSALNHDTYLSLESYLSLPAQQFFEEMYSSNQNDGALARASGLFNNLNDKNSLKISSNPYLLSEPLYNLAAAHSRMKSPVLLTSSAQELSQKLAADGNANLDTENRFDFIMLSNISDYAKEQCSSPDYLGAFAQSVIIPLAAHMNPGGIICAAYVYATGNGDNGIYRSDIDDPSKRRAAFGSLGMEYVEKTFDSVIPDEKDMIILLQK